KVVEVTSLGAAFGEPKVVGEPQPFDARAKLDGVPAEASELREAIAAIQSAASGKSKQSGDSSAAQELRGWLGGLIGSISSQIARLLRSQNYGTQEFRAQRRAAGDQGLLGKANGWLT